MSDARRVAVALHIDEPYPHHQNVLAGIQAYAREHPGWEVVIDEHPGYAARGEHGYDGVIARAGPVLQRRLKKRGIPLVNTWYQHARADLPGVYLDAARAGRLAADHLLERGFQRLAVFAPAGYRLAGKTARGFVSRAEEKGRACRLDEFELGSIRDRQYWLALRKRLQRFLDELTPPTGVFVIIDWVARILVTLCQNRGWHVPQDISLICEYDVHGVVDLPPQISSLDCNYERMGHEAAGLLDRIMAGQPLPEWPILIPPKAMIARESTDFLAVEDEVVADALRYISENLAAPIRLEQIAGAVAVSPRSLQRRFKAVLGRPVSDEIRRLRVTMAQRLLAEKEMQVAEIARATGFSSPAILYQVFQRELGMPPGAYREQILGQRGSLGSGLNCCTF